MCRGSDGDPHRLYEPDVFAYDLYSRLGPYASVPLLVAHKPDRTLGVLAERLRRLLTWVTACRLLGRVLFLCASHTVSGPRSESFFFQLRSSSRLCDWERLIRPADFAAAFCPPAGKQPINPFITTFMLENI